MQEVCGEEDERTLVCPRPSPLKPSPGKMFAAFAAPRSKLMRFSKEVAEEAEKELSSIFVAENNSASSSSTAVKSVALALSTPSPSHNVMDSPSPKRQFSSASPFSPLSRAQNPSTNTSPGDDEWSGEGAELGLLAFSPERGRHKRLSGGGERANASRKMFV